MMEDYEIWLENNSDNLWIECAESGADREMGFDFESFCERRYEKLSSINKEKRQEPLLIDNSTDLISERHMRDIIATSSQPNRDLFEREAIQNYRHLISEVGEEISCQLLAQKVKEKCGLQDLKYKIAYNTFLKADKTIFVHQDGSLDILDLPKGMSSRYTVHFEQGSECWVVRDGDGYVVGPDYGSQKGAYHSADILNEKGPAGFTETEQGDEDINSGPRM